MGKQVKKRKQSRKKKKMNNRGFTLIELLAVITIMGILMMVAIPAVSRTIENSRRDSFATIAQNYVNAVRNSVMADEIECQETAGSSEYITASATPNGTYYFEIDSDEDSAKDLMESGGASSWGGAQVKGYVVWQKADQKTAGKTQTTTKTTYKISLVDKGHHGIPTYETDQKITRAKVVTNVKVDTSSSSASTEPTSGGSTPKNYSEFGASGPHKAFQNCTETEVTGEDGKVTINKTCTDIAEGTVVQCRFK